MHLFRSFSHQLVATDDIRACQPSPIEYSGREVFPKKMTANDSASLKATTTYISFQYNRIPPKKKVSS